MSAVEEKLMAKENNQTENVFFNENIFDLNQKHLQVFQVFLKISLFIFVVDVHIKTIP